MSAAVAVSVVTVLERVEPKSADSTPGTTATADDLAVDGMGLRLDAGTAFLSSGASTIELTTTRIGDFVAGIAPPEVERGDGEVTVLWPDVSEWYRRRETAFEHGYTIDRPLHTGSVLTIDVAVDGAEVVEVEGDLMFARDGEVPMSYRDLHVVDATGAVLPATMSPIGDGLRIEIVTAGAVYPITVDPTITDDQRIDPSARTLDVLPAAQTEVAVGAFGEASPTEATCGSGAVLTGLTAWRTTLGNGWIRALELECTPLVLTAEGVALDNAQTFTGPRFNDPFGADLPPQEPPVTESCADGSVVTGFRSTVGGLVDSIELYCAPLLPEGGTGEGTFLPLLGVDVGNPSVGPHDCMFGMADGLTGSSGDDVNSLGLSCSTISVDLSRDFGSAVAVDGNRMVVTAPRAIGRETSVGSMHVYERSGPDQPWLLDATIRSPRVSQIFGTYLYGASFGASVDIRGDQIAVAASDHFGLTEPGIAWLYTRVGPGDWGTPQEIASPAPVNEFGASIAIVDTDRVLIGAPTSRPDFPGGSVYEWTPEGGLAPLPISAAVPADARYGTSIAVDTRPGGGYRLVVGAPGHASGGAVYILEDTGEGFTHRSGFSGFTPSTAGVGTSVDVWRDRVVVAGYGDGSLDSSIQLHVIETFDGGGNWSADVVLNGGSTAGFEIDPLTTLPMHRYVDIDGDVIAAFAPGEGGRVNIFRFDGTAWSSAPVDELVPTVGEPGDRFGSSISVDGETFVVGAPGVDAAYAFLVPLEPTEPPEPPGLTFGFDLAGAVTEVPVAPSGIAVNRFNRSLVESRSTSTVAASSISAVELADTSLAAVPISATPLSAIVLESAPLSAIPLSAIDVDGGWDDIIAGTALEGEPFSTLTFRDALRDPEVSGTIGALPLAAIDVRGTPLSAIPLSAIALGATPLSAIPLSAIDQGDDQSPWCPIIASLIPAGSSCSHALDDLNLMEVTLRGVPLSAIPLSAIPLSAIDLSAAPLSAIPLSAIDLRTSPLSAIPLSAIPLSAIQVGATPLSAIPLSAIPLSAIPLSAIDVGGTPLSAIPLSAIPLSAIPTSIQLSAVPLSATEVDGTPLSAIGVQGAPLSAIPLSAILIADTPLSAIPLSAISGSPTWCAVLADAAYNCDDGVDPERTTLRELSLRGVPLSAIPLSAIPLSAIPLSAIGPSAAPLSAIPLSAIPLSAIPLSAIPLSAIDVAGSPLSAIPLSAIDVAGSPLSAIPLSAIPLSAIGPSASPLSAIPLSAIPLSAIPLSAIPLSAIDVGGTPLSAIPLSAIDVLSTPLSAIPLSAIPSSAIDCTRVDCASGRLGDAIRRGAVDLAAVPLSAIQSATSGTRLGDVADAFHVGRDALRSAVDTSQETLGDLDGVDDLTLGDLPSDLFGDATLGQLIDALFTVTFGDLVAALDDPAAGNLIRQAIDDRNESLGELDALGDVTLGDLMAGGGPALDLADIAPVLGFINVKGMLDAVQGSLGTLDEVTLGELSPEQLGQLTLADLVTVAQEGDVSLGHLLEQLGLAGALQGFTLADLLIALIDPASQAFGGFRFEQVDVTALPSGSVAGVRFRADFALSGSLPRVVEVDVALPSTAGYVPGSARIAHAEQAGMPIADPVISGSVLTWRLPAEPGQSYVLEFEVLPAVRLGATSLAATATVVGTDIQQFGTASVQVVEGLEPNDYPATTQASDDTIYLTYISTPSDRDVFRIQLQENDRLLVELSNLDADLDLALYAAYADPATGASLSRVGDQPPLIPVSDPDADGADSEPLDDFPRLDLLYPADGLELLQVANRSGTANETLSTGRLPAGTYYLQVHGVNGAVNINPASLQLKVLEAEARPACVALGQLPAAAPGVAPALSGVTGNTLFLVNEMRLEQFHGAPGRAAVVDALDALVTYLEATPALGIDPIVVPVDAFPDVRASYQAWDAPADQADACDPGRANAVVGAINATVVDELRDQLDHIVLVGGDEIIPMARLLDRTTTANEYDFRHEFDGDLAGGAGANAFSATFWAGHFLSDEPYGESAARSLGDRHLYVTDVALGRLVETPAEIAQALDTFVDFEGRLDVSTATVLGYDFLSDGSRDVADTLADALGAANVDDELAEGRTAAGAPWDRAAALDKLVDAATRSLVSLNAHFDHYRALPAIGDKVPDFADNLIAADVRSQLGADALAQSLVFSMGCHSGLSVSDVLVGPTSTDWAQSMAQLGALYVGNTGFGYGDTVRVAYTEELMALFAEEITRPLDLDGSGTSTTIGQALAFAKNRYVADNGVFSVYDEKAVMESTFYGLPFYRVGLAPVDPPAAPSNVTAPDVTGTPSLRTSVTSTNDPVSTGRGTYYANVVDGVEQAIVAPGRPIQPKATTDVSVVDPADTAELAAVATGAIVLGMESRWDSPIDPVIATPTFDLAEGTPEPTVDDDVFPARPVTINTVTEPGGQRQRLVVATGQYRSTEAMQRLDDRVDLVVYYRDPAETDVLPPVITRVDSLMSQGQLTVQVAASDAANVVDRVYVLVAENPGPGDPVEWRGLDLTLVDGHWVGSLTLTAGTTDVEFIVQAKDAVGNVGYATNKARNFLTSASAPLPPPPPGSLSAEVITTPTSSGWFDGDVTVAVTSLAPATYSIDGAAPAPVPASGTFVISADGVRTWTVTTSTGWSMSGTVRIDTDGAPRITVASPTDGGVYPPAGALVDVACRDVSLTSCALTVDGQPVANAAPLPTAPGTYQLKVTAADALGNTASTSVTFTVEAVETDVTSPTVSATVAPAPTADGWHRGTVTVTITADDGPADGASGVQEIRWTATGAQTGAATVAGDSATLTVSASGETVVRVTAVDVAGNEAEVQEVRVRIDTVAPVVTISAPTNGAKFTYGQSVNVSYSCSDTASGIASCTGDVANGGLLPTDQAGTRTFTVTAVDRAGNTTTRSLSYQVTGSAAAAKVDQLISQVKGYKLPAARTALLLAPLALAKAAIAINAKGVACASMVAFDVLVEAFALLRYVNSTQRNQLRSGSAAVRTALGC